MSQVRVLGLIGAAVITAAAVAYAQTTVNPLPDNTPVQAAPLDTNIPEKADWGDAKNGATLAGACAACHGLDGNPTDPQYPRIAGQPERYVAQQLHLFKTSERNSGMAAVMKPFADPLTAQQMRDLGAYFATQTPGAGIADDTVIADGPNAGKKFYEIGETLYIKGDPSRGLPACMACHGPAGAGNPGPPYPAVAGQYAPYAQRRLEEYRAGTAQADRPLFHVMASVAKKLTDEEIGSLASYLQGLHTRSYDFASAATPTGAPAPAGQAAPGAAPAAAPAPAAPTEAAPAAAGAEATPTTGS
ncbi:c-type cytochrome [Cognatilysobacter bugurensis]|uniref:Cytochrome c n=1 Tax=Cognatilysobacter bugurensis TaxID=543356 RepID=A0A918W920_9GAMM|nr:c-type cytochrome [Lysobacter bugurensis]GHA78518.1 cytochrome c [Lysobacter bugurensis]